MGMGKDVKCGLPGPLRTEGWRHFVSITDQGLLVCDGFLCIGGSDGADIF